MTSTINEFTELSKELTNKLTIETKKNNGIFFTPSSTVKKLVDKVFNITNKRKILEPSCGSGQFIDYIIQKQSQEKNKKYNLNCIELNQDIYQNIHEKYPNIKIENKDFLDTNKTEKYDIIIGNPPFFVIKNKEKYKDMYKNLYTGRINIFILFIAHSMELLNEKGVIGFILPNSFLNCMYYNNLRKEINKEYEIIDIINCNDKYLETEQNTINLIIKKNKSNNNKFIFKTCDDNIIFNTSKKIQDLNKLIQHSKTLNDMKFKVSVGNVVWNQVKDLLTDDDKYPRLIYSGDIKDNKLANKDKNASSNDDKKNFIKKDNPYNELLLVVNRGYGKGKYKFNYCLIDTKKEFFIENHLICIKSTKEDKSQLKSEYEKIIKSFNNDNTKEFIKLYFENNAINTYELQNILPIFS